MPLHPEQVAGFQQYNAHKESRTGKDLEKNCEHANKFCSYERKYSYIHTPYQAHEDKWVIKMSKYFLQCLQLD